MNRFKQKQQHFLENHEQIDDAEFFRLNFKPTAADAIAALITFFMFALFLGLIELLAEIPK